MKVSITLKFILIIQFTICCLNANAQITLNQVGSSIDGAYTGEKSGSSVAISDDGKTMVIGSSFLNSLYPDSGIVRVYEWVSGAWTQKGADILGFEDYDYFGDDVAISANGEFVAVGAPGYVGGISGIGRVCVYRFVSGNWVLQGSTFFGSNNYDQLGESISISDNGLLLAIGIPGFDNYFFNYDIGMVNVYELDTTSNTWNLIGSSGIIGENDYDQFGSSVSLSADGYTVSVGAPFNDGNGSNSGHARIYTYDTSNSTWIQKGNDINGEAANDQSGFSITLNEQGTKVAIGAIENDASGTDQGHVRVFEYDNSLSDWVQLGSDIDGTKDYKYNGWAIDFNADGTKLLVGEPYNDSLGYNVGQGFLYEFQSGNWNKISNILNAYGYNFGYSVSLADDSLYLAIGAPETFITNGLEGQVRVYNQYPPDTTKPKVIVSGKNVKITNGDNTPDVSDNTNFGNNLITNSLLNSFVIKNGGSKSLYISNFTLTQSGSEFIHLPLDKDTLIPGDSVVLDVIYTPTTTNNHTAKIEFNTNDSSANLFEFTIEGTGISNGTCLYDTIGNFINGGAQYDYSGKAVAISANGKIVAVAAPWSAAGGTQRGRVKIYKLMSGTWTQLGSDIVGEADNDESGTSISMSNDGYTIAIGSPFNNAGGTKRGQMIIYQFVSGSWIKKGTDIEGNEDNANLGYSVSLSADGNTAAASSVLGNGGGTMRGEVRIYKYNSGSWNLMGSVINGEADYDASGNKISLSKNGLNIAIGSQTNYGTGYFSGHVRVYNFNGTSWSQLGSDIDGQNNNEYSGSSVSLSDDGKTVAIGAPYNDDIDQNNGVVRIYKLISGAWIQQGSNIYGELKNNFFGTSLALNSAGNKITIGAPYNNGNGQERGHVRTYQFNGSDWVKIGIDLDGSANYDNFGYAVAMDSIGNYIISGAPQHHVQTGTYSYNYYAGQSKVFKLKCGQPEIEIKGNGKNIVNRDNTADSTDNTYFGELIVGDSISRSFTIYNKGVDTLKINKIELNYLLQTEFKVKNIPSFIIPGDSAIFSITYSPVEPTIASDFINIYSNDEDEAEFGFVIEGYGLKSDNCQYGLVGNEIIGTNDVAFLSKISLSSDGKTVATRHSGFVKVQTNINGNWEQLGNDIPEIGSPYNNIISLSGDATTMALGSHSYNGTGAALFVVRVYKYSNGSWVQKGSDLTGNVNSYNFNSPISLSDDGNTLAVGSDADTSKLKIYTYNGSNWVQKGATIVGNSNQLFFASNIKLNADGTIVSTSYRVNSNNSFDFDTAKFSTYQYIGSSWTKLGSDIQLVDKGYGALPISIDLSDDGLTLLAGGISVFTYNGTDWVQKGNDLKPRWGIGYENVISGDGSTVALGRFSLSTYGGAYAWGRLHIYKFKNGKWLQGIDPILYNPEIDEDLFAYSISINIDGSTVASVGNGYAKVLKYNCSKAEIKVFGNNYKIEDGDYTPGIPDSTNFGNSIIGVGLKHHFKIKNSGMDTLKILSINSSGINASDFVISNAPIAIKAGDSAILDVTFTPSAAGTSLATISIESNALINSTYNFDVTGKTPINMTNACNFTQLGIDIDPRQNDARLAGEIATNGEGNIVAIGSKTKDDQQVYVYRYANSTWTQLGQSLLGYSSDADDNSFFGSALALSNDGSWLAVGAPAGNYTFGSVKVYKLTGNKWIKQATVNGNGFNDGFGNSVSLSADGQIMAVGSSYGGALDKGYVRIFKNNNNVWAQLGADIIGENNSDLSGTTVALNFDGNVVAIGAPKNDDAASNSGQVRVYKWISGTWTLLGSDIDGLNSDEEVGRSISINNDGTVLGLGIAGNSVDTFRGKARVYKYNGSSWSQIGTDLLGQNVRDSFGYSISLNGTGNIVAIGSPHSNNGGTLKGSTSVFQNSSSNWVAIGTYINGETTGDKSGSAVKLSIDGTRLLIGAPNNKGGSTSPSDLSGNFRVFDLQCNECKLTSPIPNNSGIFTSSTTNVDSGYTCYCDSTGKLLLALDLTSSGAVIPSNGVKLQIGTPTTIAWSDSGGIISHTDGAAIFNRKWDVTATTQPSSSVKVKYFFTQLEYDSVRLRLVALGNNTITSPSHLEMYKLSSNGFDDPHATGAVGTIYTNAAIPSLTKWSYNSIGGNHCAEFLVSSFSGGGGGASLMPAVPLPLEFLSFTAKGIDQTSALLKWQTASEVKTNYYIVERSLDGINFIKIANVNANGTNSGNYQYMDYSISIGTPKAYYRIKQVDQNGVIKTTNIQLVTFGINNSEINVYPNPFSDEITLELDIDEGEQVEIDIIDMMGKTVLKRIVTSSKSLIDLSTLSNGVYTISIFNNGLVENYKLLKN